jgi:hypothetical protein
LSTFPVNTPTAVGADGAWWLLAIDEAGLLCNDDDDDDDDGDDDNGITFTVCFGILVLFVICDERARIAAPMSDEEGGRSARAT